MKKFWSVLTIVIGVVYMGEAVASWWGYQPKFNWGGSMACGMASVELGVLKFMGRI